MNKDKSKVRDSLGAADFGGEILRGLATVPFILRIVGGRVEPLFIGDGMEELLGVAGTARFSEGWLQPWIHPQDAAKAVPSYDSLKDGNDVISHVRVNQAKGNYCWLRQKCRLRGQGTASDYQIVGLLADGTESQAVFEQQRQNLALAQMASDWHWEQDAEFRYTKISPEFEDVTGLPPGSLIGKRRWEIVPDAGDASIDWESHQRGLRTHLAFRNFEFLGRHGGSQSDPFGRQPIWMRESGQPRFDDEGRFVGYIGVATMIGELKQTSTEYQKNPPYLRTVLDRLPLATLALDEKLNSIYQNERFEELFGLPYGQPEHGTSIDEISRMIAAKGGYGGGDSDAKRQAHVEDILAFKANVLEFQTATGGTVMLTGTPVLVQNAPSGYVLIQTEPADYQLTAGRRRVSADIALDHASMAAGVEIERRQGESADRRAGTAEEQLKYKEIARQIDRHYAAIFHQAPLAMSVIELAGNNPVLMVSDVWLAQFEMSRNDMTCANGLTFSFIKTPIDRRKLILLIERRTQFTGVEMEYQIPGSSSTKWCRAAGRFFDRGGKTYLVSLFEEITEQKKAEEAMREFNARLEQSVSDRTDALQRTLNDLGMVIENLQETQDQLVQSQKLAALGSMVAGVAHELNTPIGNSLMVATHLTKTSTEMDGALKTGLKRSMLEEYVSDNLVTAGVLVRNLGKAAELVSSFKQVAVDRTSSQRRSFNLAEMIAETVTTLGPSLKKTPFVVEQDIDKDIRMDSYPGPLGQVLTNLINNGILHGLEGMSEGRIRIEGRRAENPDQVMIRVIDSGKGIPPDVLPRIFDPFFTTKRGSGGSGLGLHIVHNMIARVLSGNITVESEAGKGACFTITIAITAPEHDGEATA